MIKVNLLPKEERVKESSGIPVEFFVVVFGVIISLVGLYIFSTTKILLAEQKQELESLENMNLLLRQKVAQVNTLQSELGKLEEIYQAHKGAIQEASLDVEVFLAIQDSLVSDLWLEKILFSEEGLELLGYCLELTSMHGFVTELNRRGLQASIASFSRHQALTFNSFVIAIKRR